MSRKHRGQHLPPHKKRHEKKFNWHHKRPRSLGGASTPENMSYVPVELHRAWHLLFQNYEAQQIADIINQHWLDPAFVFLTVGKS